MARPLHVIRRIKELSMLPVMARWGGNAARSEDQWARVVPYRQVAERMRRLRPEQCDALEISGGSVSLWKGFGFRSYRQANYPDFDVCAGRLPDQYDVVIADQVFEHLLWPYRAGRNVHAMLRPGGYFLMLTPFLLRVHNDPVDCSRWTSTGIRYFLAECGFPLDQIESDAWGNAACVVGNFWHWARYAGQPLHNEPQFPVVVWALARKAD